MKPSLKSAAFFCLYYSGLEYLLARVIPARAVAVLMYHGVCDQAPIPAHINFHVERDVFERQMRALKRRYRVVPLSQVVSTLAQCEPLHKAVALTFDDGYRNNCEFAEPVLKALGLPSTVFVATKYVETGKWMPLNSLYWRWSEGMLSADETADLRRTIRDQPSTETRQVLAQLSDPPTKPSQAAEESFEMLSWPEIRQMATSGVEFGSHTHSHCNMAVESDELQMEELRISEELLKKNLGRQVTMFAYPYGKLSEASRANVIRARYSCALSTEYGVITNRTDRYRLPRLGNDSRIWVFTGEILVHFVKQTAKDAWSGFFRRSPSEGVVASKTEEHNG